MNGLDMDGGCFHRDGQGVEGPDLVRRHAQEAMHHAIQEAERLGQLTPRIIYLTEQGRKHTVPLDFDTFAGLLENRETMHWLAVFREVGGWFGNSAWTLVDCPDVREVERQRWPAAAIETLAWANPKVVIIVQDHVGGLISPRPLGLDKALVVAAIAPTGAVALVAPYEGRGASGQTQAFASVGGQFVVGGPWNQVFAPGMSAGTENFQGISRRGGPNFLGHRLTF